jgi:prepilin-type N-terminal cleavage/methylation domain-containing protein
MVRSARVGAFSLLELLCGLAVLSILLTLSAPMAGRFRSRAQSLQCAANLKGLGAGAAAYLAEHENCWPQIVEEKRKDSSPSEVASRAGTARKWIDALAPYGTTEKTWRCPTIEAKISSHGTPAALQMPRLDYAPTPFGPEPGSARQWPSHPWFTERSPNHGLGPKLLLTNGRVLSMEDLLKELP